MIEFLASPSGGKGYAEANNEYPLKGYGNNATLKSFGPFKADAVTVQQMGAKNRAAVELMEAGAGSKTPGVSLPPVSMAPADKAFAGAQPSRGCWPEAFC